MNVEVNFQTRFPKNELFSGRKNGIRARKTFHFEEGDIENIESVTLVCSEDQVVTSSYYLGLLELFVIKFNTLDSALEKISMEGLSDYCRRECLDALEYTFLDDLQAF
jgi:hypothetical protein